MCNQLMVHIFSFKIFDCKLPNLKGLKNVCRYRKRSRSFRNFTQFTDTCNINPAFLIVMFPHPKRLDLSNNWSGVWTISSKLFVHNVQYTILHLSVLLCIQITVIYSFLPSKYNLLWVNIYKHLTQNYGSPK